MAAAAAKPKVTAAAVAHASKENDQYNNKTVAKSANGNPADGDDGEPPLDPNRPKVVFSFKQGDPTELFQILARVGKGAFGSVYKAKDKRDGDIVAVKVLAIEPREEEALAKEMRILDDCHHVNIVGYRGTWKNGDEIWIVMEFCVTSLSDMMDQTDMSLGETELAAVMKQSLAALTYLHDVKRTIHRDIKAGNILLTGAGDCKLADFGVSAELVVSYRETFTGTPYWMAPEVLSQNRYDFKCDVWSLGITCIELAQRLPPLYDMHHLRAALAIPKNPPPKLAEEEKYSAGCRDFVAQCLTKKPEDRPSAKTLLSHPWIVAAKDNKFLAKWLQFHTPTMEAYKAETAKREREAEAKRKLAEKNRARGNQTIKVSAKEAADLKADGGADHDPEGEDEPEDGGDDDKTGTVMSKSKATNSDTVCLKNSASDTVTADLLDESAKFADTHKKDAKPRSASTNQNSAANLASGGAAAAKPAPVGHAPASAVAAANVKPNAAAAAQAKPTATAAAAKQPVAAAAAAKPAAAPAAAVKPAAQPAAKK